MRRGRAIALALAVVAAVALLLLWGPRDERDSAPSKRRGAGDDQPSESAPTLTKAAGAPAAQASPRAQELEQRLAGLLKKEAELKAELEALRAAGETRSHFVERCAKGRAPGCPVAHPPQDVLDARARCGTMVTDGIYPRRGNPAFEDAGMTEREWEVLSAAAERVREGLDEALLANWHRATGEEPPDLEGHSHPTLAIESGLRRRFPETGDGTVAQLARELAGHEPRPESYGDRTPYYWHMRARFEAADRLEEAIAEELGAERARELRMAGNGWGGGIGYSANLCDAE